MQRATIFITELVFLILLLALGCLYFLRPAWFTFVPATLGPIPTGVPWYGALGAVLVSLAGVFEHEKDWDPEFWEWHLSRPLIGATLAIISVLVLKAGILAVGSNVAPTGQAVPANLLYYLIAFVVGYREETFRELIKRVSDIILTPGNGATKPTAITAVNPNSAPHGTPTPVILTGSGLSKTTFVLFGATAVPNYKIDSDTQITVTTPAMAGVMDVKLTIVTNTGSAEFPFKFT